MVQRSQLSGQIGVLVDRLRADEDKHLEIADIASVTEVLIASMEAYFRSVDIKIYAEFRDLSAYIDNARSEIAGLVPTDIKSSRLPRAGLELDAIVRATETATNGIMEAAEAVMALDATDVDAYKTAVEAQCMHIFEHCSFQDITGQRISKVVETLEHIENRINALKDIWGVEARATAQVAAEDDEANLLRGPALEGEGIDQSEVDALLGEPGKPTPPPVLKTVSPKPVVAPQLAPVRAQPAPAAAPVAQRPAAVKAAPAPTAPRPVAVAKPAAPPVAAQKAVTPAPVAAPETRAAVSEEATQAEIDALFA